MGALYCIDTSALIQSWRENYRPRSFPKFWADMEEAIKDGILISPMLVLKELERKDDEVLAWANDHPKLFVDLTPDVQKAQDIIVNRFTKLVNEAKGRSLCDPWVIALAQVKNCPVVTDEQPSSLEKPKIPDVCKALGIGCMRVADLIEALDWSF